MRNGHLILGIDPGIHGAIAGIWTHPPDNTSAMRKMTWVHDMPHVSTCKGKPGNELDVRAICAMFQMQIRELGEAPRIYCMIERIWAHPGSNPVSLGELIRNAALIEGAAIAHGIRVARVAPSAWKGFYPELKPPKDTPIRQKKLLALELARKMWPEIDLSKAKDDGKAEALLIARYALREVV